MSTFAAEQIIADYVENALAQDGVFEEVYVEEDARTDVSIYRVVFDYDGATFHLPVLSGDGPGGPFPAARADVIIGHLDDALDATLDRPGAREAILAAVRLIRAEVTV